MAAGRPSFDEWITAYPRSRILRFIHRAPILLWRLGLGPVVGRFFLLVTTRGRKSGLPRRTVVSSSEMGGRRYSPCPYGEQAEWYRNLVADPRVTIQTDQGARSAVAVRVSDDDELASFYRLREHADRADLGRLLDQFGIAHDPAALLADKDRFYLVRFDPSGPSGLPPQRADLAWAWALLAAILLAGWRALLRA